MSGTVRPYASSKIGSNLNHSEVILVTVYHTWMNDILLKIA